MTTRLLLDTHTVVWAAREPDRIPSPTLAAMGDLRSTIVVSAVSAWEIANKVRRGRLPEGSALVESWTASVARIGAELLDVTSAHALAAGGLEWAHSDPFDRLLVAQAQLEDLTLVTKDRTIRGFVGVQTLW